MSPSTCCPQSQVTVPRSTVSAQGSARRPLPGAPSGAAETFPHLDCPPQAAGFPHTEAPPCAPAPAPGTGSVTVLPSPSPRAGPPCDRPGGRKGRPTQEPAPRALPKGATPRLAEEVHPRHPQRAQGSEILGLSGRVAHRPAAASGHPFLGCTAGPGTPAARGTGGATATLRPETGRPAPRRCGSPTSCTCDSAAALARGVCLTVTPSLLRHTVEPLDAQTHVLFPPGATGVWECCFQPPGLIRGNALVNASLAGKLRGKGTRLESGPL